MNLGMMTLLVFAAGLMIIGLVWAMYERNVRRYWEKIGRNPEDQRDRTAPRPLAWTLKKWIREKKARLKEGKNPLDKYPDS